jgi:acyl-CoA reductase-like NAD-dependent aldehyde dehydrogenase
MSIDWIARAQQITPNVRNLIEGRWCEVSGERLEKLAPRNGRILATYGAGNAADVDVAVMSARRAFDDGRWSSMPPTHRHDVLLRLAELMRACREELALLECLDVGKPISEALAFDVSAAADLIQHSAEMAPHVYGRVYSASSSNLSYELLRPVGVAAGIVGWNFPLLLAAKKIAPALATGNSIILKPSEFTSLSAARLAELALDAGLPPGVVNVVHGGAVVGNALALHRDVDLIAFTGSTATGKRLLIASGESNMKRLVLECGGKAPNIVFEDCPHLEAVADAVVARAFWNQGEVCTASSRLLVQASVKDDLLRMVLGRLSALVPGDPLNPQTKFGALVSAIHERKVREYVSQGEDEGARLLFRSEAAPPVSGGFYVSPVVFDSVCPTYRIAQQEIFGPVLSVISFRDEAEAIQIANGTMYGLSAIVWTRDLARAHRMLTGIHAGWVTVFGTERPGPGPVPGVMSIGGQKQSGLGLEGGIEGLRAFMTNTAAQVFV